MSAPAFMGGFFRRELAVEENKPAGEPREFVGDGTFELAVPGCQHVHAVFVDGFRLDDEIVQQISIDQAYSDYPKKHYPHRTPVVMLDRERGVLLRCVQSNDGRWQSGSRISVWADWEPAPKTSK